MVLVHRRSLRLRVRLLVHVRGPLAPQSPSQREGSHGGLDQCVMCVGAFCPQHDPMETVPQTLHPLFKTFCNEFLNS